MKAHEEIYCGNNILCAPSKQCIYSQADTQRRETLNLITPAEKGAMS